MARKRVAMNTEWHVFSSSQELANQLAATVASQLAEAIAARGTALLAISGGTTPRLFLEALSKTPIEWEKVYVTLADERFVPPSSDRSNAGLTKQHLLRNRAADATFIPLYHPAASLEEAAQNAAAAISALPLPLDIIVLGMGTDGHTASFFPDAENIAEILSSDSGPTVLPVISETAQEPRLTLSMPTICNARSIVLHIEGDAKKAVLQHALNNEPQLPIRAVIERANVPVHVYWASKD